MKIDLIPGVIPYKSQVRLLNLDQKENLRDQIDEWLEQGLIKPSISPWASPLVPVKKKDGQRTLLTFSGEPWAHFGHLAQVVQAQAAVGIKIQPCKKKLFQSEVEYLGHKISRVEESFHRRRDKSFSRLRSRRSIHFTTNWSKENIAGVETHIELSSF